MIARKLMGARVEGGPLVIKNGNFSYGYVSFSTWVKVPIGWDISIDNPNSANALFARSAPGNTWQLFAAFSCTVTLYQIIEFVGRGSFMFNYLLNYNTGTLATVRIGDIVVWTSDGSSSGTVTIDVSGYIGIFSLSFVLFGSGSSYFDISNVRSID